jgi:hypothetical protein
VLILTIQQSSKGNKVKHTEVFVRFRSILFENYITNSKNGSVSQVVATIKVKGVVIIIRVCEVQVAKDQGVESVAKQTETTKLAFLVQLSFAGGGNLVGLWSKSWYGAESQLKDGQEASS